MRSASPSEAGRRRPRRLRTECVRKEAPATRPSKEPRGPFCALCLLSFLQLGTAHAHPGGLNSEGCHNNRKTGDYHCHRGSRAPAPNQDRMQAAPSSPDRSSKSPSGAGGCGSKTYCTEMSSCSEARFHLEQCGLSRLDGDGDGMPCESLCRCSGFLTQGLEPRNRLRC